MAQITYEGDGVSKRFAIPSVYTGTPTATVNGVPVSSTVVGQYIILAAAPAEGDDIVVTYTTASTTTPALPPVIEATAGTLPTGYVFLDGLTVGGYTQGHAATDSPAGEPDGATYRNMAGPLYDWMSVNTMPRMYEFREASGSKTVNMQTSDGVLIALFNGAGEVVQLSIEGRRLFLLDLPAGTTKISFARVVEYTAAVGETPAHAEVVVGCYQSDSWRVIKLSGEPPMLSTLDYNEATISDLPEWSYAGTVDGTDQLGIISEGTGFLLDTTDGTLTECTFDGDIAPSVPLNVDADGNWLFLSQAVAPGDPMLYVAVSRISLVAEETSVLSMTWTHTGWTPPEFGPIYAEGGSFFHISGSGVFSIDPTTGAVEQLAGRHPLLLPGARPVALRPFLSEGDWLNQQSIVTVAAFMGYDTSSGQRIGGPSVMNVSFGALFGSFIRKAVKEA